MGPGSCVYILLQCSVQLSNAVNDTYGAHNLFKTGLKQTQILKNGLDRKKLVQKCIVLGTQTQPVENVSKVINIRESFVLVINFSVCRACYIILISSHLERLEQTLKIRQ